MVAIETRKGLHGGNLFVQHAIEFSLFQFKSEGLEVRILETKFLRLRATLI